jgi:hypothetical protein
VIPYFWLARPPLWPPDLPGLGPKTVIPFTVCQDCQASGGSVVEESVRLSTGKVVGWAVTVFDSTFAAYGGMPLCLRHVRARLPEDDPAPRVHTLTSAGPLTPAAPVDGAAPPLIGPGVSGG